MSRPPEGEAAIPGEVTNHKNLVARESIMHRLSPKSKSGLNVVLSFSTGLGSSLLATGHLEGILFIGTPVTIYCIEKFIEKVIDPKK